MNALPIQALSAWVGTDIVRFMPLPECEIDNINHRLETIFPSKNRAQRRGQDWQTLHEHHPSPSSEWAADRLARNVTDF